MFHFATSFFFRTLSDFLLELRECRNIFNSVTLSFTLSNSRKRGSEENKQILKFIKQTDPWACESLKKSNKAQNDDNWNMDDEAETYKLWRIRKTVMQVCWDFVTFFFSSYCYWANFVNDFLQLAHDRGYLVTQDELDQTLEQFKEQFGDKPRWVLTFLELLRLKWR